MLTDRELIELILSDSQRREAVEQLARAIDEAVEQLASMMNERQREGRANGKYEVTVFGRQISSAMYQHHCSHTLPERVGERAR